MVLKENQQETISRFSKTGHIPRQTKTVVLDVPKYGCDCFGGTRPWNLTGILRWPSGGFHVGFSQSKFLKCVRGPPWLWKGNPEEHPCPFRKCTPENPKWSLRISRLLGINHSRPPLNTTLHSVFSWTLSTLGGPC